MTRDLFLLDPDVCFLNHGSFGATPEPVLAAAECRRRELERRPVEFLQRRLDGLLAAARAPLAAYLGAGVDDLAFVANATTGVNVVARSLRLEPGDEVLSTALEYGACDLTWEHWCERAGARYVRRPLDLADPVGSLFAGATERTRAVYVSHVTSKTALVLPVAEICAEARRRGLLSVVDGAHAPAQVPLDLAALGADLYSGNCHKWLCAPKGCGFLWARPEHQPWLESPIVSWGWSEGGGTFVSRIEKQGTDDPAAYLAAPAAVAFVEEHDDREASRALALEARGALAGLLGTEPVAPDERYVGRMVSIPVPDGVDGDELKRRLYDEHRVEIPVTDGVLRASFAMYNDRADLERLLAALSSILGR
ncbi:MAG TPA: aminotransferase class V-fold PLP-dependent enzyme [Gaiellaceae bacterium]|nr:aminotransferase class V-fold PLP-dependent enzyme [Gaiellaceae bacterium]